MLDLGEFVRGRGGALGLGGGVLGGGREASISFHFILVSIRELLVFICLKIRDMLLR
jgi:hypothetical protein